MLQNTECSCAICRMSRYLTGLYDPAVAAAKIGLKCAAKGVLIGIAGSFVHRIFGRFVPRTFTIDSTIHMHQIECISYRDGSVKREYSPWHVIDMFPSLVK